MNKLYYAVVGGLIMCLILLSFSSFFIERIALLNIIFLFVFGSITGGLIGWLCWDYFSEKEMEFYEKKILALEERYYKTDQERLAFIHKLQIESDALKLDYENLKLECADNLGLSDSEKDFIGVGGTD
jgi:hypothetical protein